MNHYFKRKRKWNCAVPVDSPPRSPTPSDIECYTPSNSPKNSTVIGSSEAVQARRSPSSLPCQSNLNAASWIWQPHTLPTLSSPGHLRSMELIISATRDFYSITLHLGKDQFDIVQQPDAWNVRRFYYLASSVSSLLATRQWEMVQDIYSKMLDQVRPLLRDWNPGLLVCIIQICCRFWQDGQALALRPLLGLLGAMAAKMYSPSHSIHLLCRALLQSLDLLPDLVAVGIREAVEILNNQLGPDHPQTLVARRGLQTALMNKFDYAGAFTCLYAIAEIEARVHREDNYRRLDTSFRIIYAHLAMKNLPEVSLKLEQITGLIEIFEEGETKRGARLCYLVMKGVLLRLQGDSRAMFVLREALEFAKNYSWSTLDGWSNENVKRDLSCAGILPQSEASSDIRMGFAEGVLHMRSVLRDFVLC